MILYLSTIETFILRDPKCSCFIASRTVMHGVQIILHLCFFSFLFFLFVDVTYLFEREHGRGWDRGRSRFPAEQGAWVGLNPWPELKADAEWLSHPGIPTSLFFVTSYMGLEMFSVVKNPILSLEGYFLYFPLQFSKNLRSSLRPKRPSSFTGRLEGKKDIIIVLLFPLSLWLQHCYWNWFCSQIRIDLCSQQGHDPHSSVFMVIHS